MKLIEQSHEILLCPERHEILAHIERVGRTCYKSEDRITPESAPKFVTMLRDRGHEAMIEFRDITVRFVTNRGVTHELVRHRMASFAQESTRYVRYDGEMEFIIPVWCDSNTLDRLLFFESYDRDEAGLEPFPGPCGCRFDIPEAHFFKSCRESEKRYQLLLKTGWSPQQAREVLPNALKTEIVVKANIREWRHIFKLRCSKAAHPQMRALMIPLLIELSDILPELFGDIDHD